MSKNKNSTENDAKARFARDVADHEMTIELDQGVHRSIYFGEPGTGMHHFRLNTWPGHLSISGDMGDYTFSRLDDMFEFFTVNERYGIDYRYWAEKLVATSRHGGEKEYSQELLEQLVNEHVDDWVEYDDYGLFSTRDPETGLFKKSHEKELRDAIKWDVVFHGEDGEDAAHAALRDFEWKCDGYTYEFHDTWEWDLKKYRYHFLWCCEAIRWCIQQYRAAKAVAA